jgi:DNA-binding CsgD family transcriptional regulator
MHTVYSPPERRCTDRIYARTLSPRELVALQLIVENAGITVGELAETMGVGINRVWQYLNSLQFGHVRLERDPYEPRGAARRRAARGRAPGRKSA